MPPLHRTRSTLIDLGLAAALAGLLVLLTFPLRSGNLFDFEVFYTSAAAWWKGTQIYGASRANLNPPAFVVFTSPIALLPPVASWVVWQAAGALLFVTALMLARTSDAAPWRTTALIVCAHAATGSQALLGQVAWILTLPLMLGWRAAHRKHFLHAGGWLGLVIAIKPFLLPLFAFGLVSRDWRRIGYAAAATAALITIAGVALLGMDQSIAWWAGGMRVWGPSPQPTLASLTGTLANLGIGSSVSAAAALLVVWGPLLLVLPKLDCEQQWLAGLVAAVLTSPLGWIHYVVWALPLACGIWNRLAAPWRHIAVAAALAPAPLVAAVPMLRPLYLVSCVALLIATVLPATSTPVVER